MRGKQVLLRVERLLARSRPDAVPRAVRMEFARLRGVTQGNIEDIPLDMLAQRGILDRKQYFDPTVEVARHQVRTAHVNLGLTAVSEEVDAAVFEESSDDADDADILGDARNTGAQAACLTADEVDFHAKL